MTSYFRRGRVPAAAFAGILLSFSLLGSRAAHALSFVFNPQAGTSQQALQGFTAAGNLWSSFLSDDVTINITIGFRSLDPGVLAQANSTANSYSYSAVRNALAADATSLLDSIAVSNLQAGSALQFLTNTTSGSVVLDNNGTRNNSFLRVNSANAKALGLTAVNGSAQDALIEFSSDFTYDFDRSNGISGGFDFVGLAVHEIGHSLGFISGVDIVDYYSGPKTGPNGTLNLDGSAIFNTLDLFRFSSASTEAASAGFGVPDLTQGAESYFSIDKGTTNLGDFSTGPYDGDGRQASHWKDNQGIGVMDPTAGPGELLTLTATDLRAFDAIGWNLAPVEIPEPSALQLIGGAFLFFGGTRVLRRRKR
ncbi:MAG: NF038122 family metalloprotease [Armatimonadota bacterium]